VESNHSKREDENLGDWGTGRIRSQPDVISTILSAANITKNLNCLLVDFSKTTAECKAELAWMAGWLHAEINV